MLEMIIGGKLAGLGPGPKILLAGDKQAGYFGTLTQAEFFTASEVYSKAGFTTGAGRQDSSILWCKFYYRGEIVYIPTRPVTSDSTQVSWQDIYKLGLVYGGPGPGTYPDSSGPVDQDKRFQKLSRGRIPSSI